MTLPISDLPTPPTRKDPSNFAARGDAFLGALPTLVDQMNEAIDLVNTCIAEIVAANAAGLGSAASNAAIATSRASDAESYAYASAQHANIAWTNAVNAAQSAQTAANTVATIANGPVTSVNGMTGVVTGLVMQSGSDIALTRQIFKDCAHLHHHSGEYDTLDYTNGSSQRWEVASGSTVTLVINNWPPFSTLGELLIEGVNLGSATITWPTINWIKSDGTMTTVFSNNGVTLRTSGIDFIFLWTRDGGTTIYGKVMR